MARAHITTADLYQPGVDSNPAVLAHGRLNNPGTTRTPFPILIVQGTADTTVPAALTDQFVTGTGCPMGDRIDYVHVVGATHGEVVFRAVPVILSWMSGQLGEPRRRRRAAAPATSPPSLPEGDGRSPGRGGIRRRRL